MFFKACALRTHLRVLVAMSGGVDSSVAAALLIRRGYDVAGAFMRNWSETREEWSGVCAWRTERRDALRVAAQLGIPLYTFDFEHTYRTNVVNPMVDAYAHGVTPNPDVWCNEVVKFGAFFNEAMRLGFDRIATGHYAQIRIVQGRALLLKAKDASKDQSYFLYRLKPEVLPRVSFPIGSYQKTQVRALAHRFGLPVATKPDSQGICFIGKLSMRNFLHARVRSQPGEIVDENGCIIGTHAGIEAFTIGQRAGVRVGGETHAWYVAHKDVTAHRLTVVPTRDHSFLLKHIVYLEQPHCCSLMQWPAEGSVDVVIRYHEPSMRGKLHASDVGWYIVFEKPVWALAPGQSVVLYKDAVCLGGGIVTKTGDRLA